MITITTQQHEFELRWKFSTQRMKRAIHWISGLLSFEEIRMIEKRKQKELHEAGLDILKMM